jgi:hypothetical protein
MGDSYTNVFKEMQQTKSSLQNTNTNLLKLRQRLRKHLDELFIILSCLNSGCQVKICSPDIR